MGQHTDGVPFIAPRHGTVRPIAYVLTALAASSIALWGALSHDALPTLHFPSSLSAPPAEPAAAALPPPRIVTTPLKPATGSPAHPAAHRAKAKASGYTIRYTFDGGATDLNKDLGGAPKLTESGANGGALRTVTHGGGDAIGFPTRCSDPGASDCARAILATTGDVDKLNPGTRRISFGATIRMRPDQTSDGANVVQKGFSTGGSEYKLQVDGDAGKPSCAIVGTGGPTIYLAKSSIAIDDGAWHTVVCDLHDGNLSITVDGTLRGEHAVPKTVSVSNSDEVRIGGKGTSPNNDQFNGELDDVWITVGS
jgi:hypothetical protein